MKKAIVAICFLLAASVYVSYLFSLAPVRANSSSYTAQGYVRSVWMGKCYPGGCDYTVVFEADNGVLYSIPLYTMSAPPVWNGLHAVISYGNYSSRQYQWFKVVKRLP